MMYYILHFWLEWRRCIYALGTREIQLLHFSQKLLHRLNYWKFSKFFTIYQIIEHFSQKWLHLLNYWTGSYYISSPKKYWYPHCEINTFIQSCFSLDHHIQIYVFSKNVANWKIQLIIIYKPIFSSKTAMWTTFPKFL